ncbi:uncharacterized protein LY89DRAFT_586856 [Mollisia scopiformis]|uniref:Uncharacterized protein n=1 Tax=Mollisia scopiformis TaxID=149040 RepID=A0A194X718_MOLSC|nr:uncharacterized protein LY89DRAFT_586856 [Mollisia scopiformis]KUJ15884.1 hypothetical protein LY89DRAFT_586856 [Mollisia scopiformis]
MSDGSSTVLNTPLRQPRILAQIRERDECEREERARYQESNIPDTAQWGQYVHSGGSNLSLPAIPSQCLLPSETGSVTSGCGSSYLKPFGGLGLRALSHIPTPSAVARGQPVGSGVPLNEAERPVQIYEDAHGNGYQSLTDVATPSARTSQDPAEDLGQNIASVQEALNRYAEGRAQTDIALRPVSKGESVHIKQSGSGPRVETLVPHNPDDENLLPRIKHVMGQLMDYPNKIQNHEHRLEQMENASFSNAHIDDLRDDVEKVDGRVDDLEERVHDLDRQMASINDGSVCGRQHVSSFDCKESVTSSAMIASAIDRVDASRVEALEAQVAELQASAGPSHSRPWEVEVVFLPFGSRLMGVWSSQHGMSERTRLGSTMTDEWTQTQHSLAAAQKVLAAHDQSSAWERSATDFGAEEENQWLMARACGLRSRVDERLRSRGLVKLVQVCGNEARDVQAAFLKAFGDLPDILAEDPYTPHDENSSSVPKALKAYLSLSSPWIPLRKVHKNSCLRFLTPSEMVTPALWTVSFLSSSVAMRHTKVRRLYVTHRDSYIQHLNRDPTDWTWQKLHPFRARPTRTTSLPHVPIKAPPPTNKRRITSFDRDDLPPQIPSSPSLQLKRRRTRSPRFSAGPPSPYTFIEDIGLKGAGGKERGMTPFAYATPHSNAPPYVERSGSGPPISVYEDESVAGNENFGGEEEEEEEEDEVRAEFEAGMRYYDDEEGGSIDLDQELQERQVDELEWEGVEESPGLAIGSVVVDGEVEMEVFEDSDSVDSVPSEYPSTQQQRENGAFRIHVDDDEEEDGDDELV